MSNQLSPSTSAIKSMRIALKLVANEQVSFATSSGNDFSANNFVAIKPCSLAEVIGASAIDLDIDVSSLDASLSEHVVSESSVNTALSFNDYFAQAIIHIEQQHTVLLSHPELPYRLLMMPAIVAAKHRCHPHAYLTGMGEADDMPSAINAALAQAKRAHIKPTQVDATQLTCYKDKFAQLVMLIGSIATRSVPNAVSANQPTDAQYWFTEMHQNRVASFNFSEGIKQHCAVFVQGTELAQASSLVDENRLFLPVSANDLGSMKQLLQKLSTQLAALPDHNDKSSSTAISFMLSQLKQFDQTQPLSAVVMANSVTNAVSEINVMLSAIDKAETTAENEVKVQAKSNLSIEHKTPSGSCFHLTSDKVIGNNGLCFVYPGVGTVYPQMFAQLPRYFPALFAQLERDGDVKAMLQADSIYAENAKTADMSLGELAIAGVGASYILTKVLTEHFGIKPNFAMGYSMGEASMWASLDVWKTPHNMIEATQTNSIFTTDISGRLDCVRQAWQLEHGEDIVWNSFVVRATPADIEKVLADFPRAYLAITQGDTCVLAGCEESCKALLKQIGKRGIAANRVTAMHTKPAMLIRDNVQAFYQQPLHEQDVIAPFASQIKFISAASQLPISLTSEAIATSIADTFCQPLDFTQLVNNARQLGASLFVEIGADRQTTTLIDKISRTSEMAQTCQAISVNAKGDDQTALLKCIAQLITHKAPISLDYLIETLSSLLTTTLAAEKRSNHHTDNMLAPQLEGEQS
ncbi:PfaB family protein [Shewanella goraebulensis]|uniref:PfaB family protein n=1 Tax=Shewanella goraebulensis TaxID=3050637 RepID=UPI00254CD41B|nr:PfaB family protein [Shewanella goraebulensis]